MCGKNYLYYYSHLREWGSKSIIRLHRDKLFNCFVPHCSMFNFQRKKFEKVKLNGVGVLLLRSYINDQLVLEKNHEWSNLLKSNILYCIVKINKIKGLIIQDAMDFVPILDNYVVILLKCIASIKDCITRTPLPF
jgi:hypothetical protein